LSQKDKKEETSHKERIEELSISSTTVKLHKILAAFFSPLSYPAL
jgi:hypothetical protein